MGIPRLDHIICHVPDIHTAHDSLVGHGFAEAWPVGPFWPRALTSGVALGGINLELMQPLDVPIGETYADTLVFAPSTIEEASQTLERLGVPTRRFEKVEPDPDLLMLRGFEETGEPRRICTNLFPGAAVPLDFFLCDYVPFLKERLGPARFPLPHGEVTALEVRVPDPRAASDFLAKLEYAGVQFEFTGGSEQRIRSVRFADGRCLAIRPDGLIIG